MIDRDTFNHIAVLWDLDTLKDFVPNRHGLIVDPIDSETIRFAGIIAKEFPPGTPRPKVVPMTRGRLQFEWCCGGKSLELEVCKSGEMTYLSQDASLDRMVGGEIRAGDFETVRDLIRWLVADPSSSDPGYEP